MTDDSTPGGSNAPDQSTYPAAQAPAPPQGVERAATGTPGSKRPIIIIGVIVVFIGAVLFLVRNNVSADDLKVGDCFNVPTATEIQTVEAHPCTESHTAEVIYVGDYTGDSYPISLSLDSFIDENCVPAFESYVGRAYGSEPELSIGYFYPSRDGWDSGDKTITCYVTQPDESPMTESLKG